MLITGMNAIKGYQIKSAFKQGLPKGQEAGMSSIWAGPEEGGLRRGPFPTLG